MLKIKELKNKVNGSVQVAQTHTPVQQVVLKILKAATKQGNALTQREVAVALGKRISRVIKPQQARSCLKALERKNKASCFILGKPDVQGNTIFWLAK